MLNLSNVTSIIQLVTDDAVNAITVQASWTDLFPNAAVPGQTAVGGDKNTVITTATTTTIVPAPAANTDRNVKFLFITNSSSSSCAITVQHFDGTTAVPAWVPGVGAAGFVLQAGWALEYNTDGNGWVLYDTTGNIQTSSQILVPILVNFWGQSSGLSIFAGNQYQIGSILAKIGPPLAIDSGYAFVAPEAGVLTTLSVYIDTNTLTGGPVTVTLYQNGTITPVSVSYVAGATGALISTGLSILIAAGDLISIVVDATAATGAGTIYGITSTFILMEP